MKKCPTCDKTYDDSMRFCQIDGTSLVDDAPSFDPYATIVGKVVPPAADPQPTASEPEPDSSVHQTVGSIPISEPDDVLDLPSNDPLKTMYVSESEMREALGKQDQSDIIEIPAIESEPTPPSFIANEPQPEPPAAETPFSAPEPESWQPAASTPDPEPWEPAASTPPPSPFGGSSDPGPVSSPFNSSSDSTPVASPFTGDLQPGEKAITAPTFQDPEPVRFDEAATMMQTGSDNPFGQSQPQADWSPQANLQKEWQNPPTGQDVPPQPPLAGASDGANKTLAVVSLITGILGITLCCGALLPSIVAIVTGVMARGKIKSDPNEYGGAGFAMAGIITGVLGLIGGIIFLIVYFVVGLASLNLN